MNEADKEPRIRAIVRKIADAEQRGGGFRLYFETAVRDLLEICKPDPDPVASIREILAVLSEARVREVLQAVNENRCPKCFDYDESGHFWCCYDSRGG